MKRYLFLIFWIVGILSPMALLVRASPITYRLFNTLFSPQWMHIFMHTLLFAVLAALLMQNLSVRLAARRAVPVVLALVLCFAILQESIQLFSEQRVLHGDTFFDIGVDMLGGVLGLLAALAFRKIVATRQRQALVLTK